MILLKADTIPDDFYYSMNNIKFWIVQNDEELGKKLIEIVTNIVETGASRKEDVYEKIMTFAQDWLKNDRHSIPDFQGYGNNEIVFELTDVAVEMDTLGNITVSRETT